MAENSQNIGENNEEVIFQNIRKVCKDKISAGIKYFTFIGAINNIRLTPRQIQLLSFINYRGTISSTSSKQEFCKMFNSSEGTIANIVSELMLLKLLVKDKFKTKINPVLRIDFDKDLIINFRLSVLKEETKEIKGKEILNTSNTSDGN